MGTGLVEQAVQVERRPRQIAEILQDREQGKEDRHRGQHHRDHPRQGPVDPVPEEAGQPPRGAPALEGGAGEILDPEQHDGQHLRRVVRADDRDPEHDRQQRQHQGKAEGGGGEQPVDLLVPVPPAAALNAHGPVCDRLRVGVDGHDQLVPEAV